MNFTSNRNNKPIRTTKKSYRLCCFGNWLITKSPWRVEKLAVKKAFLNMAFCSSGDGGSATNKESVEIFKLRMIGIPDRAVENDAWTSPIECEKIRQRRLLFLNDQQRERWNIRASDDRHSRSGSGKWCANKPIECEKIQQRRLLFEQNDMNNVNIFHVDIYRIYEDSESFDG